MEWTTRVTELLGCKYPILQGAFAGFGNWQFAAAVANTGAHGIITGSVSRTPEQLREDIRHCREATDGSFGVNLSFSICPQIEEMLEVCIEEGVSIETAVYKPDALTGRIKESGLPWIHKTARVKDAIHAQHQGVDAVIIVGLEGAGFKSPEQLPTMVNATWGSKQLDVPLIVAGGLGNGRGFLGALGMGAEGIMMGTAFMATKECPTNEASKEAMVESRPDNPQLRNRVLGSADPTKREEVMKKRGELPVEEWLPMLERVQGSQSAADSSAERTEQRPAGVSRAGSLAVGTIDHVSTVKELVDSIIQEAEELLDGWKFLKTR